MSQKINAKNSNLRQQFVSKMWSIRPKNLKIFLQLYYLTYVKATEQTQVNFKQQRKAKIRPGLHFIQHQTGCSKSTAQDYLRAIQITHEIFLKHEIEKRGYLIGIDKKEYEKFVKKLARKLDHLTVILGVRRKKPTKLREARNCLTEIAEVIEQAPGVFTPQQVGKILRELASLLY